MLLEMLLLGKDLSDRQVTRARKLFLQAMKIFMSYGTVSMESIRNLKTESVDTERQFKEKDDLIRNLQAQADANEQELQNQKEQNEDKHKECRQKEEIIENLKEQADHKQKDLEEKEKAIESLKV
jgi:3'-phosphoadenosine 5'-phosphosulfate sulfotransferase (PAPS reductase)/FAD synthetase